MILIQIVAAALLLLGSALLFRALVALDAPSRPRALPRARYQIRSEEPQQHDSLPRAA